MIDLASPVEVRSISATMESTEIEAIYLENWVDVPTTTNLLLGNFSINGQVISRGYPMTCPFWYPLVVKSVKVKPITFDTDTYARAELTVSFGVPKADEKEPPEESPYDMFDVTINTSAEAVSIPGKAYKWVSNNKPLGDNDIMLQKWIPTIEVTFKSERFMHLDVGTMATAVAHVNSGTFYIPGETSSFGSGQVLFLGAGSTQKWTSVNYNNTSLRYAPRDLKFQIKPSGWNYFFDTDSQLFKEVTPHPYDSASFSTLFEDQGGV